MLPHRPILRTTPFALAVLATALTLALAPHTAIAEDNDNARVELMLIQENGQTRALSVSVAHGPYVETAGLLTENGVSTGAIASLSPVGKTEAGGGYQLFTSTVGGTLD